MVSCSDCGHVYVVAGGQKSGTCRACGNIEFFGENARELTALSEEIVARRVLPRLREEPPARPDPREAFRAPPDGRAVEAVRIQYQVEWQLWAALVKRFEDPVYHMAYLTQAMAEEAMALAADRYREHRSVMVVLEDSRWQAEIADLMLARIESLSLARLPNHRGDYSFDLPDFLKMLPYDSRVVKVAWVAFGLFFVAKLLHLHPM